MEFGNRSVDFNMDDESCTFLRQINKMKAAKARFNRMNVLRQKKAKRLKRANKENECFFSPSSVQQSSSFRTPLSTITMNTINISSSYSPNHFQPSSSSPQPSNRLGLNLTNKDNDFFFSPISVKQSSSIRTPLSTITMNTINVTESSSPNTCQPSSSRTQPSTVGILKSRRPIAYRTNGLGLNLTKKFNSTVSGSNDHPDVSATPVPATDNSNLFSDSDDNSTESFETDSDIEYPDECNNISTDMHSASTSSNGYYDVGDADSVCQQCGAQMWYLERKEKHRNRSIPKFSMCCRNGKIQLPFLKMPPKYLQHLLFDSDTVQSRNFQQNIRMYNMMFAFTSPGTKMDNRFNNGGGPPTFRIQGQACHRIGSMLPMPGQTPKFAQLYIYDTEHEIQHRINGMRTKTGVDIDIVTKLSQMLYEHNVHAQSFQMARDILSQRSVTDLKLRLISDRKTDGRIYNQPTVSEVAALIVGDVDTAEKRDIIMHKQSGDLQRIDEYHSSYLGYQYPLLFPYGEDGYRPNVKHRDHEWMAFRIQSRQNEAPTLLRARRLFQQFLVDGYTMLESERLRWLRKNQSKLRVGKYHNLNELNSNSVTQGSSTGKRVVLPSSYVGSRRYMDQLYFDGMAICSYVGFPDLFITFTCNPNWPEIQRYVRQSNLKPADRPDIICRVFKMKFDELLSDLTKKSVMGKVLAYMYTIEFQKRGLPHAHIIIFLHPTSKYPNAEDIDKIISAEIPDENSDHELYNLVKSHMIHGPCGRLNLNAPCTRDGKCSKYFPKEFRPQTIVDQDGFPVYRRRDNGHTVLKNGIRFDNRHVVPYNSGLLKKFRGHINMEWCNQSSSIKYLFKYINKGYDRITAAVIRNDEVSQNAQKNVDEIKQYLDCRYVSPCEACWRIFSFPIHGRKPAVERLFFHCEGENSVFYRDMDRLDTVLEKPSVTESMFTAWFEANKKYPEAKELTYSKFVGKFVYVKKTREWKPRKKGYTIGRLVWVPPSSGELYYLRMMLTHVKGPHSYEDIKIVNNKRCNSFRDACFAMGFIGDDREYIAAIEEASHWGSGHYLRLLFVHMLLSSSLNRPTHVWKKTWQLLSDGILYEQRRIANNREMILSNEELVNLTLVEVEKLLQKNRKSLSDFVGMPQPNGYVVQQLGNRLIYDERNYDIIEQRQEYNTLYQHLTDEQRTVFKTIIGAVNNERGGVFFLYGYGGTGKTYIWRTLASCIRSRKQICLTVASSGIASLLLPGGRTAHSMFKIPIPTLEESICDIPKNTERAELLRSAKLIIWDEAPMANKYCFEALDKTLKDLMSDTKPSKSIFGGKVVVFGGDFRQILPVIPRGSRSDIIHASINSSYIWDHCKVLRLTKNMRLLQSTTPSSSTELEEFSNWTLDVGDGKLAEPNDGYADIDIPKDMLISNFDEPIKAIIDSTYPDFLQNYKDPQYLQCRAILAGTLETVDVVNRYALDMIPGDEKIYLSSDSVDQMDADASDSFDALTTEFLNTLTASGLPQHSIRLKVGTPIMLLRNIDQSEGLCNGTRLIVTKLADHVIEARIISGKNIGSSFYIPRMDISPTQSPWPFKLTRRQFPIIVSYAMTINKSQGQSLDYVGLYLPRNVFSHGQLYVAISRVKSKNGLKILIHNKDNEAADTTTNVVFKEVFENV
ncbi:uncharacterized protein LOC131614800 [Vicia villosa]|uniref:uncharacterized protein LOC131614800 n=1 Tax=Vicia villosa TaxID=3911 RepID=UPI00273B5F62|nr:uncharacterized protein LOC131614800 [Vicia villosa]